MDNYGGYDPNQGQYGQGYDQNQGYGGFDQQPAPAPVAPKSNAPKIIAIAVVVVALIAAAIVFLTMGKIKGTYKGTMTESGITLDITLELDGKKFTLDYSYSGTSMGSMTGTYKKNGKYVTFYVDGEEWDNAKIEKGGKRLQFYDTSGNKAFVLEK